MLPHEIGQDLYINRLIEVCRSGREQRFMDRLLLASLVERLEELRDLN